MKRFSITILLILCISVAAPNADAQISNSSFWSNGGFSHTGRCGVNFLYTSYGTRLSFNGYKVDESLFWYRRGMDKFRRDSCEERAPWRKCPEECPVLDSFQCNLDWGAPKCEDFCADLECDSHYTVCSGNAIFSDVYVCKPAEDGEEIGAFSVD